MANEIRVVLLGKTGTGKSSLGNSLLGQKIFTYKSSFASASQECIKGESDTSIGRLLVVDTPGLFDTDKPNENTIEEMVKFIGIISPGPHVFIVVMAAERFTEEDFNTVAILKQILGEGTIHHVIAVVTRKDQIIDDGITVDQFMRHVPQRLTAFLTEINKRYEFISNRQSYNSHQQDVANVLSLIKRTVQQNGNRFYTQTMFQAAETVIQDEIKVIKMTENKSEMECRQVVRTAIANNDKPILRKILKAVISFLKVAIPLASNVIPAFLL